MDKKSQIKCIKYGFTIVRADDQPTPRIKYLDAVNYEWRTMRKFETKAARDRELKDLLTNDNFIAD